MEKSPAKCRNGRQLSAALSLHSDADGHRPGGLFATFGYIGYQSQLVLLSTGLLGTIWLFVQFIIIEICKDRPLRNLISIYTTAGDIAILI